MLHEQSHAEAPARTMHTAPALHTVAGWHECHGSMTLQGCANLLHDALRSSRHHR